VTGERRQQTDHLRGELGKATRLIANTSIRMLRYGATVSWPSTSWRSDNDTSVAYPRSLRWRRRIGRWLVGLLATTLAAFRAQV
jgi:hypothetical protein